MSEINETMTSVATAMGDLRASVRHPADASGLLPGIVLVDGSGDGDIENWARWATAVGDCGAVVLAHDKPGCGGSPGHWRDQGFADRAAETLAAVEVLRGQPGVDPNRVGLLGISQGGWISYLAASLAPAAIHQVVSISGPGVTPTDQERYRIANIVGDDPEAMAWVDERSRRYIAGEDTAALLADQSAYIDRPWYKGACEMYDVPEMQHFLTRNAGFDPATVLPGIQCPVFAAFGGADPTVPVVRSLAILSGLLPADPRHAFAVFPGADHNLYITEHDATVPLADQLTPGFLPMLRDWLAR